MPGPNALTSDQRQHLVSVASKMRRAARNKTGTTFTKEEMRAFLLAGALELAMRAELEELLSPLRSSAGAED